MYIYIYIYIYIIINNRDPRVEPCGMPVVIGNMLRNKCRFVPFIQ